MSETHRTFEEVQRTARQQYNGASRDEITVDESDYENTRRGEVHVDEQGYRGTTRGVVHHHDGPYSQGQN